MNMKTPGFLGPRSGLYGIADVPLKRLIFWGDHLKIGHPSIDAQHEAIFNLAVEISDIWQKRGNLDQLRIVAEKLAKVLERHFAYEERQLQELGYPRLDEHAAEHKVMLKELKIIRARIDKMEQETSWMTPGFLLNNFILGVTMGHIFNSDMDYCAYARTEANKD